MASNFHIFLFIYIFLYVYIMLINNSTAQRESGVDESEDDLTKGLTNEELEAALGTLSLNDLNSLKRFMDSSFIINEDDYDVENSEDDGNGQHLQNYQFENSDREFNENANYKIDENVIKYKRAVLAAHLSWENKRRVRDTVSQLNAERHLYPKQAAVTNADASQKSKRNDGEAKQQQQQEQKNLQSRSVKSQVLRTKRENEREQESVQGQVISEEYLKQLENSFPRNQGEDSDDAVAEGKEHVRVKRN